jgi:tripartite-type tricarboxylate transporter receptor subunit TctC
MSVPSTSRRGFFSLLAVAAASCAFPAHAQPTSTEHLRLVIPFAAGATIDGVGRLVASKYEDITKRTVLVENKTGAGGILGTALAAKAHPDGNTIVLVANNFSTTPAIRSDLPFDAVKDFSPISLVGFVPYAIVVPADSPAGSVKDLFEAARSSKQAVSFGTLGVGSHGHFIGAQLEKTTGVPLMLVPYKGQTEMMTAVMGGHLQVAVLNLAIAVSQMQGKRVKVLATLTEKRHPLTPNIPTFSELGYGPLIENAWYGLLTAAGTPAPAVEALRRDIGAALNHPDVKAKLTEMGIVPAAEGHAKFAELIGAELAKYTRIAKEANIKAE